MMGSASRAQPHVFVLALCALLASTGCDRGDPAENAALALARGDRAGVLDAIERLERSSGETPEGALEVAQLLTRAGEAPEAVWHLERAVERWPEDEALRLALAQAALVVSDASLALRVSREIGVESPRHAEAIVIRAHAHLALGRLERALELFQEAEDAYPESPARWARLLTLVREKRLAEARDLVEEAGTVATTDEARAAVRIADLWLSGVEAGEPDTRDAALAQLEQLVEADPTDAIGWNAWIAALVEAGQSERARAIVRDAAEREPERDDLKLYLAELEASLAGFDAAEAALIEVLERSPSVPVFVSLARIRSAAERHQAAIAALDRGLSSHPEDPTLLYARAELLIDVDELPAASEAIDRLEAASPGEPRVAFLRARHDLAAGDAERAVRKLRILVTEIDDSLTQFWLGRALEELGDDEGAARRYGMSMARNPRDPAPRAALLALAMRRGDAHAAAAQGAALVRLRPSDVDTWLALSRALLASGKIPSSERVARAAVRRFPESPEAAATLALVLRQSGRPEDALTAIGEAVERQGERAPELSAEEAMALGVSGRLDEGLALVERDLARHPEAAALHHARGAILLQLGQVDAGSQALERALEIEPDELGPLLRRARFFVATGDFEAARVDLARYREARPLDARAPFLAGLTHELEGHPDLAARAYRRAAELDDQAWQPRNNLAVLLAAEGDLDGALEAAQQAYAIAAEDPNVLDTLGTLYLEKGLVERSIALLERAHEAGPGLEEPVLHLAQAYRRAGRGDDARVLLEDLRARENASPATRAEVEEGLRALE